MVQDGDIKKIDGQWYMFSELPGVCRHCDQENWVDGWINVDKVVKKIIEEENR